MTNIARGTTTDLQARVTERAVSPVKSGKTVFDVLVEMQDKFGAAIPKASGLTPERFIRMIMNEFSKNPNLLRCGRESLLGACMQASQLGLEFGPLGLVYLVPFKDHGRDECQMITGYKGLVQLYYRSPEVQSVYADVVYEGDEFDFYRDHTGPKMHHKPCRVEDRGEPTHYYGQVVLSRGGSVLKVMDVDDIRARRDKFSKALDSKFSPWNTNPTAMHLKTPIRAMAPWVPLSTDTAQALAGDEEVTLWKGEHAEIQYSAEVGVPEPAREAITVTMPETKPDPVVETGELRPALSVILGLSEKLQVEANQFLDDYFAENEFDPEIELSVLNEWLESPALPEDAAVPQGRPVAPVAQNPPSDAPAGEFGGSGGLSDEDLEMLQNRIGNWSAEVCNQKLQEFGEPATGNLASKRLKLLALLGPMFADGDPSVTDLFNF
jgi:recombination protein RecT